MAAGLSRTHVVVRFLRPVAGNEPGTLRVVTRDSPLCGDGNVGRVEVLRAASKTEAVSGQVSSGE